MSALLAIASVASTLFAAIAAVAALRAIKQARDFHNEDVADRRALHKEAKQERAEAHERFEREMAARRLELADESRARLLAQLQRIADSVSLVRTTAVSDAEANGSLHGHGPQLRPKFFWNARKQLEAAVDTYVALGGKDLKECRDLATGSTMNHLDFVVGATTDAFDEIARLTAWYAEERRGADPHED